MKMMVIFDESRKTPRFLDTEPQEEDGLPGRQRQDKLIFRSRHPFHGVRSPGIPDRGLNIALHFVWATDPYVNVACLVLDGSWRLY